MQISRCTHPRSILSAPPLASLAIAPAALTAAAQQPPKTFSGQLDIREREILVSLPTSLGKARLQPADFQVLVDGQPREVSRAERASRAGAAPGTTPHDVDPALA